MEAVHILTFYRITMETYNGKKLYLKSSYGNKCEWTFDKSETIWFETEKEAQTFAKRYFKNFRNYQIEGFNEMM